MGMDIKLLKPWGRNLWATEPERADKARKAKKGRKQRRKTGSDLNIRW